MGPRSAAAAQGEAYERERGEGWAGDHTDAQEKAEGTEVL
jgi:hypothetical protein